MINQIYECGLPLDEKIPHRTGNRVAVFGNQPQLPLIFTGPLVFNWTRRIKGLPVPRLDDGALVDNQPLDLARLNRWLSANITVKGSSRLDFCQTLLSRIFRPRSIGLHRRRCREIFSAKLSKTAKKRAIIKFILHRRAKHLIWFRRRLTAKREVRANFEIIV